MSDIRDHDAKGNTSAPEAIPHSGKLGLEYPVHESDTPLSEDLAVPESFSDIEENLTDEELVRRELRHLEREEKLQANTPEARAKRRRYILGGIALVAAGAVTVVSAALWLGRQQSGGIGNGTEDDPGSTQTLEPVDPGNGNENTGGQIINQELPTVESLEIPSGQSDEKTAEAISKLMTAWIMAGTDDATYQLQYEGNNTSLTQDEFIQEIANSNVSVFAPALFGVEWQDPAFQPIIDKLTDQNKITLKSNYGLRGENVDFYEHYNFVELVKSEDLGSGSRMLEFIIQQDDNREDSSFGPSESDGNKAKLHMTIQETGSVVHISSPVESTDGD